MKLSIAVFCCLFAVICGQDIKIIYPETLFKDAAATQLEINEMQTEIFTTITDLRLTLSQVLKRTSNLTLTDIESNIESVLSIDSPVRVLFFESNNQSTECLFNLRYRLNYETEFTGFVAGLCLQTYDTAISAVIEEAYKTVGIYDNELAQFELSVIAAFSGKNIWIEQDEIRAKFTGSFEDFKAKLDDLKTRIDGIGLNIEQKVEDYRKELDVCYTNNRNDLATYLRRLEAQLDTCLRFDRSIPV